MVAQHYRWDFIGLSTDEKPTPETSNKVTDGSTYYCSDTSKLYVFYKDTWYERTADGGGGASYTAGDGIDITNNEISVDTETIQPKLTAGTNITIDEDNVISAEGGGATVVQTIGQSTTDVMSQKAVTDTIFKNGNSQQIQIGTNANYAGASYYSGIAIGRESSATSFGTAIGYTLAKADSQNGVALGGSAWVRQYSRYGVALGEYADTAGENSISIGHSSQTNAAHAVACGDNSKSTHTYSVALGANATTTRAGEVNVGTGSTTNGYNSTSYRVIGGVHDGQDAHDAVTVEQVNSVIDAINTALSISIPHIGA